MKHVTIVVQATNFYSRFSLFPCSLYLYFIDSACGGVTTGPSETAESNEATSTSSSTETASEDEEPAKPFANLSPGLSICEYFSLTLDYKETGTITSPDFPNHYGNHSQCSMLLSACPLCRINIKVCRCR